MKKVLLLLLFSLLLAGCVSKLEKEAISETYTTTDKVIEAIQQANKAKFKNYLFLDLREIPVEEYITGFKSTSPFELDDHLKGRKTFTFIMVLSDSSELTSERVSYIESKGFINVKSIDIPVETLLNALREAGLLYKESCPPGGC